MKHGFPISSCAARLTERAACAARCRGKTGKGKISTEALASNLALPGEPISRETDVASIGGGVGAISPQLNLRAPPTSANMSTRVAFSTAARTCVRVKRPTRAAVENSCTAVQHLTKTLFLPKPVEHLWDLFRCAMVSPTNFTQSTMRPRTCFRRSRSGPVC